MNEARAVLWSTIVAWEQGKVTEQILVEALDIYRDAAMEAGGTLVRKHAANCVQARHGWQSARDVEEIDVRRVIENG